MPNTSTRSAAARKQVVAQFLVSRADGLSGPAYLRDRGVPDPDDDRYREQVYGGKGLLSYVIDDDSAAVHVFSIVWAG
jgi:hypothetical protein